MRRGRYLVLDLDFDVLEPCKDAATAVRFATWLARGRPLSHGVFVTDEAKNGEIVWPERSWLYGSAIAS